MSIFDRFVEALEGLVGKPLQAQPEPVKTTTKAVVTKKKAKSPSKKVAKKAKTATKKKTVKKVTKVITQPEPKPVEVKEEKKSTHLPQAWSKVTTYKRIKKERYYY